MARNSRRRSGSGDRAGRILRSAVAILLGVGLTVAYNPARGQAGASDPEKGRRLQAMDRIAKSIVMQKVEGGSSETIAMLDNPIFRFDDPARSFSDGTVWAWGRSGRPAALLTLSIQKKEGVLRCLGELTSLSTFPISASGPDGWAWTPQTAGAIAQTLPEASRPAEDEAKRLRQMRDMVRRFKAFELFEPVARAPMERYELRLLPQPVHRYSDPKAGLLDGAIFLFTYGTNPEIALQIETRREGKDESKSSWTYGLARIAGAELHVELDRDEVWKQPRVPRPSPRDPYGIVIIPMQEVEITR
jgi:hypothetical protein